jgi:hypothetical protein
MRSFAPSSRRKSASRPAPSPRAECAHMSAHRDRLLRPPDLVSICSGVPERKVGRFLVSSLEEQGFGMEKKIASSLFEVGGVTRSRIAAVPGSGSLTDVIRSSRKGPAAVCHRTSSPCAVIAVPGCTAGSEYTADIIVR